MLVCTRVFWVCVCVPQSVMHIFGNCTSFGALMPCCDGRLGCSMRKLATAVGLTICFVCILASYFSFLFLLLTFKVHFSRGEHSGPCHGTHILVHFRLCGSSQTYVSSAALAFEELVLHIIDHTFACTQARPMPHPCSGTSAHTTVAFQRLLLPSTPMPHMCTHMVQTGRSPRRHRPRCRAHVHQTATLGGWTPQQAAAVQLHYTSIERETPLTACATTSHLIFLRYKKNQWPCAGRAATVARSEVLSRADTACSL